MQATDNTINLQAVRERKDMNSRKPSSSATQEQREETREMAGEQLFVQITQAGDQNLVGKTISCRAVDASAHGIKFVTTEFIPVGCLLDLWVDDSTRPGKFFLSGDARWTQKVGSASTMVGVRLQEGLATDIDDWRESHA